MCQAKIRCIGESYFFFFLPVFFFAFFAFLAMLMPSVIPKLAQRKSTCTNIGYTLIAKLILSASNKVNGSHTTAREWSLKMRRRKMGRGLLLSRKYPRRQG